jgi:hypothetical protein
VRGNPLELLPGSYRLTFRSRPDAYIRFTRTVQLKEGQTLSMKVPPDGMGSVTIKANPSNCKISINGEFIDTAPIFNLPIQAGNHTILFDWEKLGKTLTKTMVVSADQTETITGVPE